MPYPPWRTLPVKSFLNPKSDLSDIGKVAFWSYVLRIFYLECCVPAVGDRGKSYPPAGFGAAPRPPEAFSVINLIRRREEFLDRAVFYFNDFVDYSAARGVHHHFVAFLTADERSGHG